MKEYYYKMLCDKCGGQLNVTYGLGISKRTTVKATCEKCLVTTEIKNVVSGNYTLHNFEVVK